MAAGQAHVKAAAARLGRPPFELQRHAQRRGGVRDTCAERSRRAAAGARAVGVVPRHAQVADGARRENQVRRLQPFGRQVERGALVDEQRPAHAVAAAFQAEPLEERRAGSHPASRASDGTTSWKSTSKPLVVLVAAIGRIGPSITRCGPRTAAARTGTAPRLPPRCREAQIAGPCDTRRRTASGSAGWRAPACPPARRRRDRAAAGLAPSRSPRARGGSCRVAGWASAAATAASSVSAAIATRVMTRTPSAPARTSAARARRAPAK